MSNETAAAISTLPADQALALRTIFEWKYGGAECGRVRLPHPDFPDEFKVRSPRKYTDEDGVDHVETCTVIMPATWTYLIKAELLITMGLSGLEALHRLEAKKLITKQKTARSDAGQLWKLPDGPILDVGVTIKDENRTTTVSVDGKTVVIHTDHPGDKVDCYELRPEAIALAERPDPGTSMVGMFSLSDAVAMLFPDVSEPDTARLRRRLGDWLKKHEDDIPQHDDKRRRYVRLDILKKRRDDFLRDDSEANEIVQVARTAVKGAMEMAKKIHRSDLS